MPLLLIFPNVVDADFQNDSCHHHFIKYVKTITLVHVKTLDFDHITSSLFYSLCILFGVQHPVDEQAFCTLIPYPNYGTAGL